MNFVRISMIVAGLLASMGFAGWQGDRVSTTNALGSDTLDCPAYDVGGVNVNRGGPRPFMCVNCKS